MGKVIYSMSVSLEGFVESSTRLLGFPSIAGDRHVLAEDACVIYS